MDDEVKDRKQEVSQFLLATVGHSADKPRKPRKSRRRKPQPGGQPGNRNALKHGLYTKQVTQPQQEALAEARKSSYLNAEIDMLRLQIADLYAQPGDNFDRIMRAIWVLARVIRIDDRVRFGP